MHRLSLAYREARQRFQAVHDALPLAHAAVTVAQRQAWLAQTRPELIETLASIEAEEPMDSQDPTASYRQRAQWRQRVASVRAEMAQVLAEAGL